MRYLFIILSLLFGLANSGCTSPHYHDNASVHIGVDVTAYPQLILVPRLPVYYDPYIHLNYFFYDGLYWVFIEDNWYVSGWYNGPWEIVAREYVPVYILQIPIRYYRQPPAYFSNWHIDEAPHWAEHWGRDWDDRRKRLVQSERPPVPAPAPLPTYQRQYSGDRYPHGAEEQHFIRTENYHYQPHEAIVQEHFNRRSKGRGQNAR